MKECPFARLQHDKMTCRFDEVTGEHTIDGQPCTFDLGGAIYRRVDLDNSDLIVTVESYDRNSVSVTKPLPRAGEARLLGWRELIAEGRGATGFLATFKLLVDESRKIHAALGLYPRPTSFFDICLPHTIAGRGSVQFLRPVHYTENALCFYRELNDTFLRLCREASAPPRSTNAAFTSPPPGDDWSTMLWLSGGGKKHGRNQKVCNLDLLKRRPPEGLRCGVAGRGAAGRCRHEALLTEAATAIGASEPMPERTVCVNTVELVLDEAGVEHECRLTFEGSRDFFAVLGRTDIMHTVLCYPNVLMNALWLEDFDRLLDRLVSHCGNPQRTC